jgi:hypothetical protein
MTKAKLFASCPPKYFVQYKPTMRNLDPDSEENQKASRENQAYVKMLQSEELISRLQIETDEPDEPSANSGKRIRTDE